MQDQRVALCLSNASSSDSSEVWVLLSAGGASVQLQTKGILWSVDEPQRPSVQESECGVLCVPEHLTAVQAQQQEARVGPRAFVLIIRYYLVCRLPCGRKQMGADPTGLQRCEVCGTAC